MPHFHKEIQRIASVGRHNMAEKFKYAFIQSDIVPVVVPFKTIVATGI